MLKEAAHLRCSYLLLILYHIILLKRLALISMLPPPSKKESASSIILKITKSSLNWFSSQEKRWEIGLTRWMESWQGQTGVIINLSQKEIYRQSNGWWMGSWQGQIGVIINLRQGNLTSIGWLKFFDTIILLVLASPNATCHLPFSQDEDEILYTGLKTLINISEHGNFSTQGWF